ncbi:MULTISPECIES: DUF3429 domain-containing protein [unclassified Colwellia]|jgi:hypothetical protein|uniref:DUF3429 domain-containing protein n=1 Tax=unclassified Colwellia TaxID=196834 RepID=UPI0015F49A99|nr:MULTISPECIES: DUF3429 domain-containing protein [unclassified Colwellia]MBA6380066.1 DUF3429 domain-containing protein [Colwellia sp. BRX10-7]MBA6387266.1 DUF3429 domain-containing protein [Colwellia sp. BRX10-2]MBA6402297.1 DUF3429 domain-containing protein [Colwellia sp. BRX10-5]MBA6406566.1 DUF3429 domain-containing protein [Colwellia sp. BRX10-1]
MKSWQLLGYLGLLPFAGFLYLSVVLEDSSVWAQQAFIAYSAIIVSFIAGTLWRKAEDNTRLTQQIISNLLSLIAFTTLLMPDDLALIVLSFSFMFLFLYEKKLAITEQINDVDLAYMRMRFWLTFIVLSLHTSAYYLWFIYVATQ